MNYLVFHTDHPLNPTGVNGGAGTATLWLARTMAKLGARVIVCAQLPAGEGKHDGIEFWQLGATYDVAAALRRARALGPYHLISACRALPILLGRDEPNCRSTTFIAHDPSAGALGVSPKTLIQAADHIICVSEAQRKLFTDAGAQASDIAVIPNGANLDLFRPGEPTARNPRRLVFVGALVIDKGLHVLINAFAKLKQQKYPDLSLDIFGSSAMWGRENYFNTEEAERNVPGIKFHGSVSQQQIAEVFRTAGASIVPSIFFDSFPLTAVEAQVCGCPVIGFDSGGIREAIIPGETGLLASEVSEEALIQVLDQALSTPGLLEKLSARALETARRRFDWDLIVPRIMQVCEGTTPEKHSVVRGQVGVVSTWNQHCGLATYAQYLFSELPQGSYIVFGEESTADRSGSDEPFVERCWQRGSADLSKLEAAIARREIQLLHLNIHARFLPQPALSHMLARIRKAGVKVVAHLHSTFTAEPALQGLVQSVDAVITHTAANRLEAIANGAPANQSFVIPHGVVVAKTPDRNAVRGRIGVQPSERMLVTFGFIQPHKGIEGLIEAVAHLCQRGLPARGFVLGAPHREDPNGASYLSELQGYAAKLGVSDRIRFETRFLPSSEVSEFLAASDLVFMNYASRHYEASGAAATALGAGALVAASVAPPFEELGDAVWHMSSGYPPALSAELLLTNAALRASILAAAQRYVQTHAWPAICDQVVRMYQSLQFIPTAKENAVNTQWNNPGMPSGTAGKTRVLVQNRRNTFTQRGGDTIVIERLVDGLRRRGVDVTVDVEGREDPRGYSLVQLFNFTLPQDLQASAERARAAGVPYVITPLCEDVPSFHAQSHAAVRQLMEYVARGQDRSWWEQQTTDVMRTPPCPRFENGRAIDGAAMLMTCGTRESAVLRRDYPGLRAPITEVTFGCDLPAAGNPQLFVNQYGVRDFVLCVGRLESRKNQLMLLKALEDSELPVVLVAGAFSYQPEYAEAVRRYRRKGQTLVLDHVSPEMLASAYAACRIHVLPSWYELPGLVSLEAASQGKNVVVTDCGTTFDYLGEMGFYCEPQNPRSIRNAVMAAYHTPASPELRQRATGYTWERYVDGVVRVYEGVLRRSLAATAEVSVPQTNARLIAAAPVPPAPAGWQPKPAPTPASWMPAQAVSQPPPVPAWSAPSAAPAKAAASVTPQPWAPPSPNINTGSVGSPSGADFEKLLAQGEELAQRREYQKAEEFFAQAERANSQSARLWHDRGAVALAQGNSRVAREHFQRALQCDAGDCKALCGTGMCEMNTSGAVNAHPWFVRAVKADGTNLVALRNLVATSYQLLQFTDLEQALATYTRSRPQDFEMKFCLAGCWYKMGRIDQSLGLTREILQQKPDHRGARELEPVLLKAKSQAPATTWGATPPAATTKVVPSTPAPAPTWQAPPAAAAPVATPAARPAAPARTPLMATSVEAHIGALEEAKRKKEYVEATKGCREILGNPSLAPELRERVTSMLAECLALQGDVAQAEQLYTQILNSNSRSARALAGKGALAASKGNWGPARELFVRSNGIDPNYDVALAGLGLCCVNSGDREGAWNYYRQALQVNVENTTALYGLMDVGYALRRHTQVEQAIQNYLELHPADLNFVYCLAGCLYAQEKLDEAMGEISKILLFESSNSRALELRQMIESRRGGARANG